MPEADFILSVARRFRNFARPRAAGNAVAQYRRKCDVYEAARHSQADGTLAGCNISPAHATRDGLFQDSRFSGRSLSGRMAHDATLGFIRRANFVGRAEATRFCCLRVDWLARLPSHRKNHRAFPGALTLTLARFPAEHVINRADDDARFLARKLVVDRLAFAPRRHQAISP